MIRMEREHWRVPQGWGRVLKGDKLGRSPETSPRLHGGSLPTNHRAVEKFHSQTWSLVPGHQETVSEKMIPELGREELRGYTLSLPLSLPPCTTNRPHRRNKKDNKHNTPGPGGEGAVCLPFLPASPTVEVQHLAYYKGEMLKTFSPFRNSG